MRFRPPPFNGRVNLRHPLCAGLRYLAFCRGGNLVPLVGPLLDGAAVGTTFKALAYGPAAHFTRASSEAIRLGTAGQLKLDRSMSVLWKGATAADPGLPNAVTAVGADDDSARGWVLVDDRYNTTSPNGGSNGTTFLLAKSDGSTYKAASANSPFETFTTMFLAGTWDQDKTTVALYRDGKLVEANNVGSFGYAAPTAAPVYLGRRSVTSFADYLDGDTYWVALFDRPLTAAEVFLWSRETWDFLAEDEALTADFPTFSFTTSVGAGSVEAASGPGGVSYSTGVGLGCASGGDIAGTGAGGDEIDATTAVSAGQQYAPGFPVLVPFTTAVAASDAYTPSPVLDLSTEVDVSAGAPGGASGPGGGAAILTDGRKDILSTRHYRR